MRSDRFLRALRGQPTDVTPVWLMRQAGRYLEGYQRLREHHDFAALVRTPELALAVSLEPLRRFEVDAAIVFADILLPLEALGLEVHFGPAGPEIQDPIRSRGDLGRLATGDVTHRMGYVFETIRLLEEELSGDLPVIGFAGGPFTLLSYAVEGRTQRDVPRLKALLWEDPDLFGALMDRMAEVTAAYLKAQVEAGAQAVQIFDSWVGALSPQDYRQSVLGYTRRVTHAVRALGCPVIHFAPLTGTYLDLIAETGPDALSVDWRTDLSRARTAGGRALAVQGNLDPMLLREADPAHIARAAGEVLEEAGAAPGHIFNLGHGVLPGTPPDHVAALVDAVHTLSLTRKETSCG